jgi:hypothetical protein
VTIRRSRQLVALASIALVGTGCGGSSQRSSTSASAHPGISAADWAVLTRINTYVTAYNNANIPWSNVYKRGNRAAFLRVQGGYTEQMSQATKRIEVAVIDIRNPALHDLLRRIGHAYAKETPAVVEVDNSVVNGDERAAQRAIRDVQAAAQYKIDAIDRLAQRFPEFKP